MLKKRLLWVGDAGCDSGFERATRYTVRALNERFEVGLLGINHRGDTPVPGSKFDYGCRVFTAWSKGDFSGANRLEDVINEFLPDVVVIQQDPWNIPAYMHVLQYAPGLPVVATLAVDGKNCKGGDPEGTTVFEKGLNGLALALFWTEFGRKEAVLGGYEGKSGVIPLGVDRSIYCPMSREEARKSLFGDLFKEEHFLVTNVNRNQPRKRMDLTVLYFAEWVKRYQVRNAFLFLHTAPTGEECYDIDQLVRYLQRDNEFLKGRVIHHAQDAYKGMTEEQMRFLYCASDGIISTSQGEGMGLPALEAMSCGTPCVLPDNGAYSEWAKDGAILVKCSQPVVTPNKVNVLGSIPDQEPFIDALETLRTNKAQHAQVAQSGLYIAANPRYDWKNIGTQFADAVESIL